MNYDAFYSESIQNPEGFWKRQAENLKWDVLPSKILEANKKGSHNWFVDGKLNMSYLCVDKHVEDGFGDQTAIYYDSPVSDQKQQITFKQLQDEVSKLAGGLLELGLQKGDTAIIY